MKILNRYNSCLREYRESIMDNYPYAQEHLGDTYEEFLCTTELSFRNSWDNLAHMKYIAAKNNMILPGGNN